MEQRLLLVKSLRSVRYSLLSRLLKSGESVLSFENEAYWAEDKAVYQRKNISIHHFTETEDLDALSAIIKREKVKVILFSGIDSQLKINDLHSIIRLAKKHHVATVVDNSFGSFKRLFSPLKLEVDYSLVEVSNIAEFKDSFVGAFLVASYTGTQKKTLAEVLFAKSVVEQLKAKRQSNIHTTQWVVNQTYTYHKALKEIESRFRQFNSSTYQLAKWLNQNQNVQEVNYSGLNTNANHALATTYFEYGFGNRLQFSLWDHAFYFNLLNSFFQMKKEKGILVTADTERKLFSIEINNENANEVIRYFGFLFGLLDEERRTRNAIFRKNELEKQLRVLLEQALTQYPLN